MKNKLTALLAIPLLLTSFSCAYADTGDFLLFKEIAEIKGIDAVILAFFALLAMGLIITIILSNKHSQSTENAKLSPTKALVFGALSLSLSFVLSYIKLFEMPFGGSITLCCQLPILLYAAFTGYGYGFLCAFAFGLLQLIQNPYIIHPVQFALDYLIAFTALGLTSFFRTKKKLPIGILVAGFARMLCSVLSGVVFFAEYAPEGMNVIAYSFIYNFLSLGVDTIICLLVYLLPPVRNTTERIRSLIN